MTLPKLLGECRLCGSRGRYAGRIHTVPEGQCDDFGNEIGTTIIFKGMFVTSDCCDAFLDVVSTPFDGEPIAPTEPNLECVGGRDDGRIYTAAHQRIVGTPHTDRDTGKIWQPIYEQREYRGRIVYRATGEWVCSEPRPG